MIHYGIANMLIDWICILACGLCEYISTQPESRKYKVATMGVGIEENIAPHLFGTTKNCN